MITGLNDVGLYPLVKLNGILGCSCFADSMVLFNSPIFLILEMLVILDSNSSFENLLEMFLSP